MPEGVSSYAVEESVWGVLGLCWLALRANISMCNADIYIVVRSCAFSILNVLTCSIIPMQARKLEIFFFQMTFGTWLAALVVVMEVSSIERVSQAVLNDPYLSMSSMSVSFAWLTVLMLMTGAAVSPDTWKCQPRNLWADIYVVEVATFHACLVRAVQPGGFYVALVLNILALVCVCIKQWGFAQDLKIGNIFVNTLLELVSFSFEMALLITVIAMAYSYSTTSFALVVFSIPAVVVFAARLATSFMAPVKPTAMEPSTRDVPNVQPAEPAPHPVPSEPTSKSLSHPFQHANLRITGDALLFGRTRTLQSKLKKNS